MTDVPAGLSLPLAAWYRDASFWSSSRPAEVASSDRSSFSLSWRLCFAVIGHPNRTEKGKFVWSGLRPPTRGGLIGHSFTAVGPIPLKRSSKPSGLLHSSGAIRQDVHNM